MSRPLQLSTTAPTRVRALARDLGQRLKVARKRRRITQKELSVRSGVAYVTVQAVEGGRIQTAIGAYIAMAWVLGLDKQLEQLFISDPEGEAMERARLPQRVRAGSADDDEF